MAKNTTMNLAEATRLVSTFHTSLAGSRTSAKDADKAFEVAKRERLYAVLGEAFGKSLMLIADQVLLGKVCAHFKVEPTREGENPHSAPVRMFWRKLVDKKMVPDPSAWKYGKGFRAAQSLGWTGANYAENLMKYEYTVMKDGQDKKLRGHAALEALDTANHGKPDDTFAAWEEQAARAWLSKQQAVAQFQADLVENPEPNALVGIMAQWDAATDQWRIVEVNQPDHNRAWNMISKRVLKKFRDWRGERTLAIASAGLDKMPPESMDELRKAMAEQARDLDALEARQEMTRKLTVFESDGLFEFAKQVEVAVDPITSSDENEVAEAKTAQS